MGTTSLEIGYEEEREDSLTSSRSTLLSFRKVCPSSMLCVNPSEGAISRVYKDSTNAAKDRSDNVEDAREVGGTCMEEVGLFEKSWTPAVAMPFIKEES